MWEKPTTDNPKSRKNIHLYRVLAQTTKNEPQMQANLKTGHIKSEFHCTYRSTKHKHLSQPH